MFVFKIAAKKVNPCGCLGVIKLSNWPGGFVVKPGHPGPSHFLGATIQGIWLKPIPNENVTGGTR
jgi:hypothetical protein